MKYAYFGHHKTASQWFASILRSVCMQMSISFKYMAIDSDRDATVLSDFDFIADVNANSSQYKDIGACRGIHVIRDPRDIIVSGYFSHKISHPTDRWKDLERYRATLNSCDINKGLFYEIDFSGQFLSDISGWNYARSNVLELKFEEVTANQFDSWLKIFMHLGLLNGTSCSRREQILAHLFIAANAAARKLGIRGMFSGESVTRLAIMDAVYNNQFKFKSLGSTSSATNFQSHYRKGVAGDWKNYFTKKHAEHFINVYDDLLVRLGYEQSDDWVQKL